jgi:hypothetical protein
MKYVALSLFLLVSCASLQASYRVTLSTPAPTDTLPERISAYQQLQPTSSHLVIVRNLSTGASAQELRSITLYNGKVVYLFEDFLPVVKPNSITAQAIRKAGAEKKKTGYWALGMTSLFVPIIAGLITIPIAGTERFQENHPDVLPIPELVAFDVAFAATIAVAPVFITSAFVAKVHSVRRHRNRLEVLKNYDKDIKDYLNLCGEGVQLYDCSQPPTPQTDPSTNPSSFPVLPQWSGR